MKTTKKEHKLFEGTITLFPVDNTPGPIPQRQEILCDPVKDIKGWFVESCEGIAVVNNAGIKYLKKPWYLKIFTRRFWRLCIFNKTWSKIK